MQQLKTYRLPKASLQRHAAETAGSIGAGTDHDLVTVVCQNDEFIIAPAKVEDFPMISGSRSPSGEHAYLVRVILDIKDTGDGWINVITTEMGIYPSAFRKEKDSDWKDV